MKIVYFEQDFTVLCIGEIPAEPTTCLKSPILKVNHRFLTDDKLRFDGLKTFGTIDRNYVNLDVECVQGIKSVRKVIPSLSAELHNLKIEKQMPREGVETTTVYFIIAFVASVIIFIGCILFYCLRIIKMKFRKKGFRSDSFTSVSGGYNLTSATTMRQSAVERLRKFDNNLNES
ncbi:unnamed protein product [Dimorphilus gyrociliatus]|uniref:Uncharacterized protein n=1 Tax=Dimorphilus gyrociliatus TaxID=2664684 RepID=A0A7I8W2F7_9ANNE|nr:unnamed protein product [Dimorphilus gyrociliatus]